MATTVRPATIAAISIGTVVTGLVGYAIYFDHRRRTDPEFRKALKRDAKKQAKAQKAAREASQADQHRAILQKVEAIEQEGYPTDGEGRERHFLESMQHAETHMASGDNIEAASYLFRCLKVYPAKAELIRMFDQTVPKDVLDVLAVMVSQDSSISSQDMDLV